MRSRFVAVALCLPVSAMATLCADMPPAMAEDMSVDVELALAVDVSGSVDEEEARLQREGYIAAITDPEVLDAIRGGTIGRIAVAYFEWSGDSYQRVVASWTLIQDEQSAGTFASTLAEAPYVTGRWTSLSGGIDFAATLMEGNGYEGLRRVIDVSGDGYNNSGRPVTMARDDAVARGITINGLPILNDRPNPWGGQPPMDLDKYFEENVIGGPGAFIVPARDFRDFGRAIRAKLIREIANLVRTPAPHLAQAP
ncbi:MAG TPA: DUF1194 domain-containing protein [Azospirillaceae bacterium]|nr:DUF1194 domain-containing protein [Azospirillaceae bacterium]